jgi:D-alanyl-D-alanine carboxypeptidase
MLPSGNDAAVALAQWGGKITANDPEEEAQIAFVRMMNKYSK